MDLDNLPSVPFEISNVNHGFQKAEGLLKLTENGMELEFELKDAFLGVVKSDVKTTLIFYRDLKSITFKKGWLSGDIILEGISMKVFDDLPGTEVATCKLKIKRNHKEEAESFTSKARMYLSEYKLNQMSDDKE